MKGTRHADDGDDKDNGDDDHDDRLTSSTPSQISIIEKSVVSSSSGSI